LDDVSEEKEALVDALRAVEREVIEKQAKKEKLMAELTLLELAREMNQ
jgi:hypothetical protein